MTQHEPGLPMAGAGLGIVATMVPALIGMWAGEEILTAAGLVGVPVAGVLGWRFAARVRHETAADAFETALRMAAIAVLLGDVVASLVFGASGNIVLWPMLVLLGLLIFGLPAFVLAFLVVWPWTFVIRRLP